MKYEKFLNWTQNDEEVKYCRLLVGESLKTSTLLGAQMVVQKKVLSETKKIKLEEPQVILELNIEKTLELIDYQELIEYGNKGKFFEYQEKSFVFNVVPLTINNKIIGAYSKKRQLDSDVWSEKSVIGPEDLEHLSSKSRLFEFLVQYILNCQKDFNRERVSYASNLYEDLWLTKKNIGDLAAIVNKDLSIAVTKSEILEAKSFGDLLSYIGTKYK